MKTQALKATQVYNLIDAMLKQGIFPDRDTKMTEFVHSVTLQKAFSKQKASQLQALMDSAVEYCDSHGVDLHKLVVNRMHITGCVLPSYLPCGEIPRLN